MRGWMTAAVCAGAVWLTGCAGVLPSGARFATLRAGCGADAAGTDYGADAQSVYSTLYDAYVAYRHRRLSQADYCAFENDIASHYRGRAADAQGAWAEYFNAQRVKAIDWRAQVDPTLRGG